MYTAIKSLFKLLSLGNCHISLKLTEGPLNEINIDGIIYSVGKWKVLGCSKAVSFRMIAQGKLTLPVSWRMQNKLYRNKEKKRNVVRNFIRRFKQRHSCESCWGKQSKIQTQGERNEVVTNEKCDNEKYKKTG